jgi:Ca2+/H+ antiporter, TMEM165/GDT1 family
MLRDLYPAHPRKHNTMINTFLISTGVVAIAEIGDKTQLLALILAARFRRPIPIILGIFVATVLNHFAAGWIGQQVAGMISPLVLRWIIGLGFLAIAAWALVPDEMGEEEAQIKPYGAFLATAIAFFLAEIGDKTQVVTVALALKYQPLWAVVAGTTVGMMIADVPAVFVGKWIASRMHILRYVRFVAAAVFALLGVLALLGVGS